jgi:hypothetical protein
VSAVDRGEPHASRSEWHGDGTAGERRRLWSGGDGTSSDDGRGPSKATRASLASPPGRARQLVGSSSGQVGRMRLLTVIASELREEAL